MQKIRINDLARELEVKSKSILEILTKVGVTEKKTHSSSIEVDEAERVKQYVKEHGEHGSSPSRSASRPPADEFKPKIDLSHISKPGDVLKAVTQRAAQPVAPPRPPATPAAAPAGSLRQSVPPPSAVPPKPAPPTAQAAAPSATATPAAEAPKPAPRFITPQSVVRPPSAVIAPPKPPAAPPTVAPTKPSEPMVEDQIATLQTTPAAAPEAEAPSVPEAEAPKVAPSVMRPLPPARGTQPVQPNAAATPPASGSAAQAGSTASGRRSGASSPPPDRAAKRTASGLYGASTSGERTDCSSRWNARARQAHLPASASGSPKRPSGYASADAARRAPWPASHPLRCSGHASGIWRRGRRCASAADRAASHGTSGASGTALRSAWCEGRPDEGLRSAAAAVALQRTAAHHAQHHHSRRHQRERPGREAGNSRQRPDRPPAGAWRVCHRQPDARFRPGFGHGAPFRSGNRGHHLRRTVGERYRP